MKNTIAIVSIILLLTTCGNEQNKLNRVFIFTDINIDSGDPDDRQSLIHLLWYSNELKIEGIVPDRWNAKGYEACELVIEAYSKDYEEYNFASSGYPQKEILEEVIAKNMEDASNLFVEAASISNDPLYVLIWGNMRSFKSIINENPNLSNKIRVITIGTNLMLEENIPHMPESWEKTDRPCEQYNWNGLGRNDIYNDFRFNNMWWLEINWTYNGMFTGDEPRVMFEKLLKYGNLGSHIKEVVKNESWAQYFRVGDTPSVLYVIDSSHNVNDPTTSSWAGTFIKPFPNERPNYFTDSNGSFEWNYQDPCLTWENHIKVKEFAKATLEQRREEMYQKLLEKLETIYAKNY